MKSFKILTVLTSLLFSAFMSVAIAPTIGLPPLSLSIPLFLFGKFIVIPQGYLLMSYVQVDVSKNTEVTFPKKDMIYFFDWDDISTNPSRDSKGIAISGNLVFSSGKYMSKIYATQSSIKISQDTEGDDDVQGFIQSIEFSHPGSGQSLEEFLTYWNNRNVGIIVEPCQGSIKKLLGTPCAPLKLQIKSEDDKDKNNSVLTFKQMQKSPYRIAHYYGTMSLAIVMGTIAADATTVNVAAGEGEYQLTAGTAAIATITTLSNPTAGYVYTLLGSGGTYPSLITSANDFLLTDGTSWSASAGAKITFKCFKSGSSSYKFYELSRS